MEPHSARYGRRDFGVFPLDQEKAVIRDMDYIHNNPVKRGLVESPGE